MKRLLLYTLILVIAIYLLFSAFFVGVDINKYQDIVAVKKQHAIQNGWIPSILPKSAYDIEETHDDRKKKIFGAFSYKEPDEATFISKLKPVHDANNTTSWGKFLFRVDTKKNHVIYRNKFDNGRGK